MKNGVRRSVNVGVPLYDENSPGLIPLQEESIMLKWALIFAVIAVVAGLCGFTGIAAGAAGIAKFLFVLFLILCVVFLVIGFVITKKIVD